jgi:hypothetical protein
MNQIISLEVKFYKLALGEMETNLYNESGKKVYYNPVRLFCQVTKDEVSMNDVDTGMDTSQIATFLFLREELIDRGVFIEEGDIVAYNGLYYEIDNAQTMQYWAGRNNETFLYNTENRGNREFGYNPTIKAQAHLTRISQLNLIEARVGINTIKNNNLTQRNL